MNVEKLLYLADVIEEEDRFSLNYYFSHTRHRMVGVSYVRHLQEDEQAWALLHDCKTAGCVAGWQNAIDGVPPHDFDHAAEALGLSEEQANELFAPLPTSPHSVWDMDDPYKATATDAARVLREITSGARTFRCDR